jgi:hypothetical protein
LYGGRFFFTEDGAMEVNDHASNAAIPLRQCEKSWNVPLSILSLIGKWKIAWSVYALKSHISNPITILVNRMFSQIIMAGLRESWNIFQVIFTNLTCMVAVPAYIFNNGSLKTLHILDMLPGMRCEK